MTEMLNELPWPYGKWSWFVSARTDHKEWEHYITPPLPPVTTYFQTLENVALFFSSESRQKERLIAGLAKFWAFQPPKSAELEK